ncbi:MAG: hypothetical protein LIP77_09120 [Planctomycetes bacterium]|nr:hypothetical protein [Planctomycetota bacterium]
MMKTKLTALLLLSMAVAQAAVAANYCPPAGCPEPVQTVRVEVPVTQYIEEPYTVNVTRMVPVEREVMVPCGRWVTERRQVPTTRTIYVDEPYTVNETRYVTRQETRMRQVTRTVRETQARVVNDVVYENVCDECGRNQQVARTVSRTVNVPVKRRVCVEEPYTVNVRVPISVPVTRTRRVARSVPATREVCERRYVTETVARRVTTMQPVVETRVQTRRRAVTTTQVVEQPVAPVCQTGC